MIISGARNSINRFNRLLRLMTRRYKSLRSDVAKRPPSNGTSGLNSGGMTGTTLMIIHSGRQPLSAKASTSFKRFTSFLRLTSEVVSFNSARNSTFSTSQSILTRIFLIASAPIPISIPSCPYSSMASRY